MARTPAIALLAVLLLLAPGCAELGAGLNRIAGFTVETPAPETDLPADWIDWLIGMGLVAAGLGSVGGGALYKNVLRPRRIKAELLNQALENVKAAVPPKDPGE